MHRMHSVVALYVWHAARVVCWYHSAADEEVACLPAFVWRGRGGGGLVSHLLSTLHQCRHAFAFVVASLKSVSLAFREILLGR
jgi:hypothetical protein